MKKMKPILYWRAGTVSLLNLLSALTKKQRDRLAVIGFNEWQVMTAIEMREKRLTKEQVTELLSNI